MSQLYCWIWKGPWWWLFNPLSLFIVKFASKPVASLTMAWRAAPACPSFSMRMDPAAAAALTSAIITVNTTRNGGQRLLLKLDNWVVNMLTLLTLDIISTKYPRRGVGAWSRCPRRPLQDGAGASSHPTPAPRSPARSVDISRGYLHYLVSTTQSI